MKRFFKIMLFTLLLSTQTVHAQQEDGSFHLVGVGDSLSSGYRLPENAGFVPVLQQRLLKDGLDNVSVINAAVPGDTTADALKRIENVLALNPHAVILEFGINDILNSINFQTSEENLDKLLKIFQDKDIPVLLIGMRAPFLTEQKSREDFIGMYKRMAKKYKVAFYPYFLEGVLIEKLGIYDLKYMQEDGSHPNEQGVKIMVEKFYPTLNKFLNSLE